MTKSGQEHVTHEGCPSGRITRPDHGSDRQVSVAMMMGRPLHVYVKASTDDDKSLNTPHNRVMTPAIVSFQSLTSASSHCFVDAVSIRRPTRLFFETGPKTPSQ